MTTSPEPEFCPECRTTVAFEWVAPVYCAFKRLPGTGQWRSALIHGLCHACDTAAETRRNEALHQHSRRLRLIALLGGEKPFREFRFERFVVMPGNRLAFQFAQAFNPLRHNLYLWGACGVGKTHLAYAIFQCQFERGFKVLATLLPRLMRQMRRRDPHDEQQTIELFVRSDLLVLDDLGIGNETLFARQVLQEILDGRDYRDAAGLVVTSKYSLNDLALKLGDDTIASRLAGMCEVIKIDGPDGRLEPARANPSENALVARQEAVHP